MDENRLSAAFAFERLRMELERPPFNRWIAGIPLGADIDTRETKIALRYRPEFSHHPSAPIFHGGILAALIDIAAHATVAVWHGAPTPTISLHVEYLSPATGDELCARGILRRLGRTISRADVEVTAGGRLVALGRGTFSTREGRE
jgi:uncharacterized protein (TIGR00369 family)